MYSQMTSNRNQIDYRTKREIISHCQIKKYHRIKANNLLIIKKLLFVIK